MDYRIEYYKDIDTDPKVFLQRFRCTTEPIGGSTELDEQGELVDWDAAVAAIEIAKEHLGWHPASEPPKEDGEYVVFCYGFDLPFMARYSEYINEWNRQNVKCWCYKPKDE